MWNFLKKIFKIFQKFIRIFFSKIYLQILRKAYLEICLFGFFKNCARSPSTIIFWTSSKNSFPCSSNKTFHMLLRKSSRYTYVHSINLLDVSLGILKIHSKILFGNLSIISLRIFLGWPSGNFTKSSSRNSFRCTSGISFKSTLKWFSRSSSLNSSRNVS